MDSFLTGIDYKRPVQFAIQKAKLTIDEKMVYSLCGSNRKCEKSAWVC